MDLISDEIKGKKFTKGKHVWSILGQEGTDFVKGNCRAVYFDIILKEREDEDEVRTERVGVKHLKPGLYFSHGWFGL